MAVQFPRTKEMGFKKKVLANTPTTRGRQIGFDNFGTHKSEAHNEKLKLKSVGVATFATSDRNESKPSVRCFPVLSFPVSVPVNP